MFHSAAVDVSVPWDKGQCGQHIKRPIRIGYAFDERIFHFYFCIIPGPLYVDDGREEMVDEANERILFLYNHFISGVDDDFWRLLDGMSQQYCYVASAAGRSSTGMDTRPWQKVKCAADFFL